MNILERPKWSLCEALTNFDSSNEKAMTHLNEVLNKSDDRYIEKVREYYGQCRIRPSIDEDRIVTNHLAMHPLRHKLYLILAEYHQRKPFFMTVSLLEYNRMKLAEWPEIVWDTGQEIGK